MAGSNIISILNYPYLIPWSYQQTGGGGANSWADSTNGTFTVPSHPFVTGDVMYVSLWNANTQNVVLLKKYYAIVVSSTQLKYADTYNNAIQGINLPIPPNLSTAINSGIGNTPTIGYNPSTEFASFYNPTTWNSFAWSLISFGNSEKVYVDATFLDINYTMVMIGTQVFGTLSSYCCGVMNTASNVNVVNEFVGTKVTGAHSASVLQVNQMQIPYTVRFTLQNKRISIAVKLNNGTYLTRLTGSQIPDNTLPLFIGVGMGLNNNQVTNCTITYF